MRLCLVPTEAVSDKSCASQYLIPHQRAALRIKISFAAQLRDIGQIVEEVLCIILEGPSWDVEMSVLSWPT